MFSKNLLIATLVATLLFFGISFLWYDIIMGDFYTQIEGVNRNPVLFPLIGLGMLIFSYAFCRLYQLCYTSEKPITAQAIQFGVLIGLLYGVSYAIIQYATRNIPVKELFAESIFNFILPIIVAVVISKIFGDMIDRDNGGQIGKGDD